jgi:hypothetical protein
MMDPLIRELAQADQSNLAARGIRIALNTTWMPSASPA